MPLGLSNSPGALPWLPHSVTKTGVPCAKAPELGTITAMNAAQNGAIGRASMYKSSALVRNHFGGPSVREDRCLAPSHYQIEQLVRDVDGLADLGAVQVALHPLVGHGGRAGGVLVDSAWHGQGRPELPVDLDRQGDRVLLDQARVPGRPGCVRQALAMAQPVPQLLAEVRRERREQQDERLDQRP